MTETERHSMSGASSNTTACRARPATQNWMAGLVLSMGSRFMPLKLRVWSRSSPAHQPMPTAMNTTKWLRVNCTEVVATASAVQATTADISSASV